MMITVLLLESILTDKLVYICRASHSLQWVFSKEMVVYLGVSMFEDMVIRQIGIESVASTENRFNQFCLNRPDWHQSNTRSLD